MTPIMESTSSSFIPSRNASEARLDRFAISRIKAIISSILTLRQEVLDLCRRRPRGVVKRLVVVSSAYEFVRVRDEQLDYPGKDQIELLFRLRPQGLAEVRFVPFDLGGEVTIVDERCGDPG